MQYTRRKKQERIPPRPNQRLWTGSPAFTNETIVSIAEAHGVSSAQVILRWDLQRGIIVIPGSSNEEHIKENLDLFDFELSEEEMEQINSLNRDEKHNWY